MTAEEIPDDGGVSPPAGRPLEGWRVVVTRAVAGTLDEQLRAFGAEVISSPAIAFADPDDGGVALREAVFRLGLGSYDWLVLTSATIIERLRKTAGGTGGIGNVRIATVGPATARAVTSAGAAVDLIAAEAVGESLVDDFPVGAGRVLVLRPEVARDVVPNGLRRKGWQVDEVVAYRTVPTTFDAATRAEVRDAEVVTFTSPSTVDHLVAGVGAGALPDVVVTIGPVTSRACEVHGVVVTAEADPHTVDGLVAAVLRAVDGS